METWRTGVVVIKKSTSAMDPTGKSERAGHQSAGQQGSEPAAKKRKKSLEEAPQKDGFLSRMHFRLHPSALGKARRAIFERQIKAYGGHLVEQVADSLPGKEVIVLLEDSLVQKEKLQAIVDKAALDGGQDKEGEYVGLSWLSICLERKSLIDRKSFRLVPTDAGHFNGPSTSSATTATGASAPLSQSGLDANSSKDATTRYFVERKKQSFVCAQSSNNPLNPNPNKHITDELEKLAAAYKSTNDTWR